LYLFGFYFNALPIYLFCYFGVQIVPCNALFLFSEIIEEQRIVEFQEFGRTYDIEVKK
jgi:hypothetical protein